METGVIFRLYFCHKLHNIHYTIISQYFDNNGDNNKRKKQKTMTKNIVIKLDPIILKISPFGFNKYAQDYFIAAEKWTKNKEYSPVPYFLYCRTIELGLKAFLLAKGEKINWIKIRLGHDLTKTLKRAKNNSLYDWVETTEEDENQIRIANKYYKTKGFEYFFILNHVTGLKNLPKLEIIKSYAEKLLTGIKELINSINN